MVDWRSLLTRRDDIYDCGAFDIRGPTPRPTLLAKAAAQLGRGETFEHPLLDLPGWWHRPGPDAGPAQLRRLCRRPATARPILITGATGTLGQAFARICAHRGLAHVLTSRAELDIADEASIAAALDRYRPWAVINAAGFVRTWEAEQEVRRMLARPTPSGPELLAGPAGRRRPAGHISRPTWCSTAQLGRPMSSRDADRPGLRLRPKQGRGRGAAAGDGADALIIRTSAFFGPGTRYNFLFKTRSRG